MPEQELIDRVRTLRKWADRERESENMAYDDLALFYAPVECGTLIRRGVIQRTREVVETLELTPYTIEQVFDRWIDIEVEKDPNWRHFGMPDAADTFYWLFDIVD